MSGHVLADFPVWVPGVPSTYSNGEPEAIWKAILSQTLPAAPLTAAAHGMTADFLVPLSVWGREGNDLDNLCDPLCSILINQKGWLGGRRPNLMWYCVSKNPGAPSGARVAVHNDSPPSFKPEADAEIIHDVYSGPLPKNVQDPLLARWVESHRRCDGLWKRYHVLLQIEGKTLNIGDVAKDYGVKGIVDSLYPLLGGDAENPGDDRITMLQVEKGVMLPSGALRLVVWGQGSR